MKELNIDKLNLSELKDLLKEMKLYRDLRKQLWARWKAVYKNLKNWENIFVVEYFPKISKELAFSESKKIFKRIFDFEVEESEIIFKEKEELKWWIRVYFNDKVLDLSYIKIERELSK